MAILSSIWSNLGKIIVNDIIEVGGGTKVPPPYLITLLSLACLFVAISPLPVRLEF